MRATQPPLALAYHGLGDVDFEHDPHSLFVRPDDLRRHVERLKGWGYELVSFGELAAAAHARAAGGLAALTFDDGLVDNLELLAPLLDELAAPATVFIVSGWLGNPHPAARWTRIVTADEVRDLARAGLEIGGHTVTHPDLTTLSATDAEWELAEGRRVLEAAAGGPVRVAAYPYGRANPESIRACREAGFEAACRTAGHGSWSEPFNLPRQDMPGAASAAGLWLKRSDRYERLMAHRPPRAARRAARWLRRRAPLVRR